MRIKYLPLLISLFYFILTVYTINAAEVKAVSMVLTNEGKGRMIDRLAAQGCKNLYEAYSYLRSSLGKDAPAVLKKSMDALWDSLNILDGKGEVFTADLMDFTGEGNSPVGINSDGTFIRSDFSVTIYDGNPGFEKYKSNVIYTYTGNPEKWIYLGSQETDNPPDTINFYAFAIAWNDSTINRIGDFSGKDYFLCATPNPASEYIELKGISPGINPKIDNTIRIYNTLGECVLTVETGLRPVSTKIDISQLPAGVYYIQIGNYSDKFVVAR